MKNTNLQPVSVPDAFPAFSISQFERACDRFLAMRARGEGPTVKSNVRFIPHTDDEIARWRQKRRSMKEPMNGYFKNNRKATK